MRLSLNITNYTWPDASAGIASHLCRIARAADLAGLDTVWVSDHLLQADPNSASDAEMLEAYTTLGFLAGQTERVRLGTMVTGATYRPPALLVKAVTTLDVLSAGRAWFGVGAGYHAEEARAKGLPLPPVRERFERLEDTLRLAIQMWTGNSTAFEGRHFSLERPVNSPQSLSHPHPPILIGGMGEQRTLLLVARYADACNLFDIPDGGRTLQQKRAMLAHHCRTVGRAFSAIEKTLSTRLYLGESTAAFVERCHAFAALGIEHVVVISAGPWTEGTVSIPAGAVRSLQGLQARETEYE